MENKTKVINFILNIIVFPMLILSLVKFSKSENINFVYAFIVYMLFVTIFDFYSNYYFYRKNKKKSYYMGHTNIEEESYNNINDIDSIRIHLKQKNDELDALREMSGIISSTFDVKTISECVYKVIFRFIGCDRCLFCTVEGKNKNEIGDVVCKFEFGSVILGEEGRIYGEDSSITACYRSKQTVIFSNVMLRSRKIVGDKITIPLSVLDELIGVIFVESGEAGKFSNISKRFLESIANYAAIAIKNAEMFNDIYLQKQEIEALYEETAAVNEELSSYITKLNDTKEELKCKNDELQFYYNDIQMGYLQTVMALANSIEAKDPYTRGHCQRVMEISCEIAKKLNYKDEEIESLRYAAILHDIGKIGIPAAILNKKGKLTDEEFAEIKKHPEIAYSILKDVKFIKHGLEAILQHHERYDGKGYPNGIDGSQISEFGSILGIADAFDAMTSDRTYRKAMPMEEAIKEVERCKGSQFNPKIADMFIEMSKEIIDEANSMKDENKK